MFGSCLPPVVCRRALVLFTLFVFACVLWCPTHIALCAFLRLAYSMLTVSLDCPFWICPSVFSNVYIAISFNSIPKNSVFLIAEIIQSLSSRLSYNEANTT
jgi:hypothetical protein